jgi:hypothetical protein
MAYKDSRRQGVGWKGLSNNKSTRVAIDSGKIGSAVARWSGRVSVRTFEQSQICCTRVPIESIAAAGTNPIRDMSGTENYTYVHMIQYYIPVIEQCVLCEKKLVRGSDVTW